MTYKVVESFGGRLVKEAASKKEAVNIAKKQRYAVDIWTTKGGAFGLGKVVDHFPGATS